MELNRKELINVSGIYGIVNKTNNKIYVGKSKNIYKRLVWHVYGLNNKLKDENRHLISAWHKYGRENFECILIEITILDDKVLKEKELYWMDKYNSLDRNHGYNLRKDTETNCIVSRETRELQSKTHLQRYVDNPNLKAEVGAKSSKFWKENPEVKKKMSEKVAELATKYRIYQYEKDRVTLVKIWDKIFDIIVENPTYKKHNIYAVCSGEKPSIYGYWWKKELINA